MDINFSRIALEYEDYAEVQRKASYVLLKLLRIRHHEYILDLGCGTGHITRRIREMTDGKVVGIDPSEGMIREAITKSRGMGIVYEVKSAEEMNYYEEFDVIFCNSTMQWFNDPEKALINCYNALRKGGRIGVQAPAKRIYSPNFIKAISKVMGDERTKYIFNHFKEPWFFLETEDEYVRFFEKVGFRVAFSKLETVTTYHTPDEIFKIFLSGAVVGYLNQRYYDVEITEGYISAFKEIVKKSFDGQADKNGMVKLEFNRIFLIAVRE